MGRVSLVIIGSLIIADLVSEEASISVESLMSPSAVMRTSLETGERTFQSTDSSMDHEGDGQVSAKALPDNIISHDEFQCAIWAVHPQYLGDIH